MSRRNQQGSVPFGQENRGPSITIASNGVGGGVIVTALSFAPGDSCDYWVSPDNGVTWNDIDSGLTMAVGLADNSGNFYLAKFVMTTGPFTGLASNVARET